MTEPRRSLPRRVSVAIVLSALTAPAHAAEALVEVTAETLGRLLEQKPIAELTMGDQAQTDKLTLLHAQHATGSNVTITIRELERDPPRSKVLVLTDSPVDEGLETSLSATISATAATNQVE